MGLFGLSRKEKEIWAAIIPWVILNAFLLVTVKVLNS